jgi:HSP20 family protein
MNCNITNHRHAAASPFPARLFNLAETLFPEIRAASQPQARTWSPAVDVHETETSYVITAELADVKPEDVKVSLHDGVLTLKGERKSEAKQEGVRAHYSEIHYGAFQRTFSLPKDADADAVTATYKNGLLTVSVNKRADQKAKEITVKAA